MAEERYQDLNKRDYIRIDGIRYEHHRNVAKEVDNTKNIHAMRWEV